MSKHKNQLLAEIVKLIELDLKPLGFRKTNGVYVCPLGKGALGWLGLNVASHRSDGRIGINPVVGLFEPDPFDYRSECQRVVQAIEVYGLPFIEVECQHRGYLAGS
jgi:hypothetical protein